RGMHFQRQYPQGKLVGVLQGRIYDVIIDLRVDSATYGQHLGFWLDDLTRQQLYVPPGCAHGFYVDSDTAIVQYKCTDYYRQTDEGGVMWNDSAFGIEWPLTGEPIIANKDRDYLPFHLTREKVL